MSAKRTTSEARAETVADATKAREIPGAAADGAGASLVERWIEKPRPAHILGIIVETDSKHAKLTFEAALSKLESIVESMESGQVPLAELLAKFEEGNKLLKVCETRLKDAEMKIEQLKKQKDGIALAPFEPGQSG